MISIRPVDSSATRTLAQALFTEYGAFLRDTQSCGYVDHAKFEQEVASLPANYADRGGGVLLGYVGDVAAGCIAFRANALEGVAGCEIKRLFVRPAMRGHGIARALVQAALVEARRRGYVLVVLDTDTAHMPGAQELYQSFGFREFGERQGSIAFFRLALEL